MPQHTLPEKDADKREQCQKRGYHRVRTLPPSFNICLDCREDGSNWWRMRNEKREWDANGGHLDVSPA